MKLSTLYTASRSGRPALAANLLTILAVTLVWAMLATAANAVRGPQSVADVAEKLQASVVNISTTQTVKGSKGIPLPRVPEGSPFEEFFKDFFDRQQQQGRPRRVNSLGSGFVIDPSGLIVTNNHVIEEADEIIINFNDGQKLKVEEIVGKDSKTDLAILRVKPEKPLTAVGFGDSSRLRVGDWVMAIGNPFGLGGTVTVGIISAKKRDINAGPYDEFLQTDAAINRGNSGGPLFNMDGEVIGVNTAIISPTGGSIGIGFAVPSNTAVHVIDQLKKFGETRRGWLGVRIQTVTDSIAESLGMDEPTGALVASVTPGSPAEKAGIEAGDVILSFNDLDVEAMRGLPRIVARTPIGETVDVEILRGEKKKTLRVTIGRLPEQAVAAKTEDKPESEPEAKTTSLLGLSIARMSDELRSRYKIGKDVKGVVVTEVEPESAAAEKNIKAGDVIVEVTRSEVTKPAQVRAGVDEVKKSGRKSVLFLIDDGKGELRFVALPVDGG
ncbi:MAG: Do family serine endopeptidase [Hyphomicrobiales bacterium]|nr:Do family serine endopeptidase [Hyphomicrobiales bacterium]